MAAGPVHRALAAFDIEKSGDPGRIDDVPPAIRSALLSVLREAVDGAAIGWSHCRWLDRGAGGVLVAPGEVAPRVVDPLVGHLAAGLRRHNRGSTQAHLRLRMAVHAGPVLDAADGVSGAPMVHLNRLLHAPLLRADPALTSAELAMLISDSLYDQLVRQNHGLLDPAAFRPVAIGRTEASTTAWLLAAGQHPATTPRSASRPTEKPRPALAATDGSGGPYQVVQLDGGQEADLRGDADAEQRQSGGAHGQVHELDAELG
jgi:hypothetical protein